MKMSLTPLIPTPLITAACLAMLMATAHAVAEPDGTPQSKPRFTLVQGKGWTVCECYVKALNVLPADGTQPYCHQLQVSQFSDLKAPHWEILNILDHLDTAYEIERKLFAADTNPKFPATKEVWQANLERRLASLTEALRLRRTRLALDPAGPVESGMKCAKLPKWCFGEWQAEHVDRRPECLASDTEASGGRALSGTGMQEAATQKEEMSLTTFIAERGTV